PLSVHRYLPSFPTRRSSDLKAAAGIIIFFFIISANIFPAEIKISKIEPPNWWAGMKVNQIQLMVYGENLNDVVVKSNEDDFKIRSEEHTSELQSRENLVCRL